MVIFSTGRCRLLRAAGIPGDQARPVFVRRSATWAPTLRSQSSWTTGARMTPPPTVTCRLTAEEKRSRELESRVGELGAAEAELRKNLAAEEGRTQALDRQVRELDGQLLDLKGRAPSRNSMAARFLHSRANPARSSPYCRRTAQKRQTRRR